MSYRNELQLWPRGKAYARVYLQGKHTSHRMRGLEAMAKRRGTYLVQILRAAMPLRPATSIMPQAWDDCAEYGCTS